MGTIWPDDLSPKIPRSTTNPGMTLYVLQRIIAKQLSDWIFLPYLTSFDMINKLINREYLVLFPTEEKMVEMNDISQLLLSDHIGLNFFFFVISE